MMMINIGDIIRIKKQAKLPGEYLGSVGIIQYTCVNTFRVGIRIQISDRLIHTCIDVLIEDLEKMR